MAPPTTTEPRVDQKAGFCGMCRRGQHELCASTKCTCVGFGKHTGRPKAGESTPKIGATRAAPTEDTPPRNGSGPRSITSARKQKPNAAVWELVKVDPPEPEPRKVSVVERARPLLEQLMAEEDKAWYRLAVFPSSMGASQTMGRLRKAYPREWEWRTVRVADVSQSAVYVRWLGRGAKTL